MDITEQLLEAVVQRLHTPSPGTDERYLTENIQAYADPREKGYKRAVFSAYQVRNFCCGAEADYDLIGKRLEGASDENLSEEANYRPTKIISQNSEYCLQVTSLCTS